MRSQHPANNNVKIKAFILFLFLLLPSICGASPFIVCDPYVPVGEETITDVEVKYIINGTVYSVTGTYTVSEDYIILYDLDDIDETTITGYLARWSTDAGSIWSPWGGVRFRLKRPK